MYPLDDEWARRYPQMIGRLACHECALGDRYAWECESLGGAYPPGHIAVSRPDAPPCIDHWSHVGPPHTPAAAVVDYPEHAVAQGGEVYMRWVVESRRGTAPAVRAKLAEFLPS